MSAFPDLHDEDEGYIVWNDIGPAYLGSVYRCGMSGPCAVYDYSRLVQLFMERDGMTEEDAVEYIDFNILGAYVGERTPFLLIEEPMLSDEEDGDGQKSAD
jgi:hypothetical protein